MTKAPGLKITTVLWGDMSPRQLADDLRDQCHYQAFNEESGAFEAVFYAIPDADILTWIANKSRPWTFSAHTVWQ